MTRTRTVRDPAVLGRSDVVCSERNVRPVDPEQSSGGLLCAVLVSGRTSIRTRDASDRITHAPLFPKPGWLLSEVRAPDRT